MKRVNYDNFFSVSELRRATEGLNASFTHVPRSVDQVTARALKDREEKNLILTVSGGLLRFSLRRDGDA